jgi:hypothetical protein
MILSGQTNVLGEETFSLKLCPPKIPHGLKPEIRDEKPATNRLNQSTAFELILKYFLLDKIIECNLILCNINMLVSTN